jgi:hypothetical protein
VILTSNKTPKTAEVRLQKATNTVSRWANENGSISTEKTKAMLIYRRKHRVSRNPKMKIRIGTEKIAMVKHHRILGLVIDERMNWNKHIQDANERVGKKLNLTKYLSHTRWGADQKTFLKMIILSTLRYDETAYGSASKAMLMKLDPIHRRGVRLALGTFAVCKPENVLCKVGLPT